MGLWNSPDQRETEGMDPGGWLHGAPGGLQDRQTMANARARPGARGRWGPGLEVSGARARRGERGFPGTEEGGGETSRFEKAL